ncbi:NucA/NucB deoxyribonuclease domain-containing protein [Kitasatospora griseola]
MREVRRQQLLDQIGSNGAHSRTVASRHLDPRFVQRRRTDDGYEVSWSPDSHAGQKLQGAIKRQLDAFRAEFGRAPGPGDPVFHPNADTPLPMPEERITEMLGEMAVLTEQSGIDPAYIQVWKKLGHLVTEDTQHLFSVAEVHAFSDTVRSFQEAADPGRRPAARQSAGRPARSDQHRHHAHRSRGRQERRPRHRPHGAERRRGRRSSDRERRARQGSCTAHQPGIHRPGKHASSEVRKFTQGYPGEHQQGSTLSRLYSGANPVAAQAYADNRSAVNRACTPLPHAPIEECNEFPFASTREGAGVGNGNFSVKYVSATENSNAGYDLANFYGSQRVLHNDKLKVLIIL